MVHRTEFQPGQVQIFCKSGRSGKLTLNGFLFFVWSWLVRLCSERRAVWDTPGTPDDCVHRMGRVVPEKWWTECVLKWVTSFVPWISNKMELLLLSLSSPKENNMSEVGRESAPWAGACKRGCLSSSSLRVRFLHLFHWTVGNFSAFEVWVRHHETEATPGCGGVRRKRTMVSSAHSEVNRRSLLPDGRCLIGSFTPFNLFAGNPDRESFGSVFRSSHH